MGLRINTNVNSLAAQRALGNTRRKLEGNLAKLSSGARINKAADDAAGLAISENLKSDIRSIRQARRNAGDAISLIQISEGALSEISSNIIRLRELSVQSASDTVGDTERSFADVEFQHLKDEIDRISNSTEYNGIKLLEGTGGTLEFQIGIHNDPALDRMYYDKSVHNSTLVALGISAEAINTKEGAQTSIKKLDDALVYISGARSNLGAIQNRITSIINNLTIGDENLNAANSRIRDVDMAQEMSDYTKNNILAQAGVSVLQQTNQFPQVVMKLLG